MRRRSMILWITFLTTCSTLLGLLGNLATSTVSIKSGYVPLIWLALILLWLITIIVEVRRKKTETNSDHQIAVPDLPSKVADQLAQTITATWRSEEERQRLNDPFPLPVRWTTAYSKIVDHWSNICRAGPTEEPQALSLDADLTSILKVYQRVPSRRLVILGKGGSGKTVLAIRLLLDLMVERISGTAVPLIFNLGSWDPTGMSLRDWMATQLERDYPSLLIQGPDGQSMASTLVSADLILPILDGFDEINEHLRHDALMALNKNMGPIVLTGRTAEYVSAVKSCDVLTAAAVIVLDKLRVKDLEPYLRRASRNLEAAESSSVTTIWDPVIASLKPESLTPEAKRLLAAMSTPLMVSLARKVYSDSLQRDPNELLDSSKFTTRLGIEEHLLDAFIETVYQHPFDRRLGRRYARWKQEDATKWLSYIAAHLNRLGSRNLAWWELRETVSTDARKAIFGVAFSVMGILAVLPIIGFRKNPLGILAVFGGIGYGMVAGVLAGSRVSGPYPTRTELRLRGHTNRLMKGIRAGIAFGVRAGILYGLVFTIIATVSSALTAYGQVPHAPGDGPGFAISIGLLNGIMVGIPIGLSYAIGATAAIGVAIGLVFGMQSPIDVKRVVSPFDGLRRDRQQALWITAAVGLGMSIWFGIGSGLTFWVIPGMFTALCFGFSVGLYRTAWGHWLLIARIWLPITGRVPYNLNRFLIDAHSRGVIRQIGAVYQFRHARLQDQLAAKCRLGAGRGR